MKFVTFNEKGLNNPSKLKSMCTWIYKGVLAVIYKSNLINVLAKDFDSII